jgi:hypothetical protein
MTSPRDVVNRQLEAYNARDLRVHRPPNIGRECEERDDVLPRTSPGLHDRRMLRTPMADVFFSILPNA